MLQKGENKLILKELDSALYYYDKALEDYNYPFYKHVKQAAIIAKFKGGENKYLAKCVEKGMNEAELAFFESCLNYHDVKINYKKYRQKFLNQIDTALMENFLEFDVVDVGVNKIDYKGKHAKHDSIHALMIKRYVSVIKEFGFPTESKVGFGRIIYLNSDINKCKDESCFTSQVEDEYLLNKKNVLKYSSLEEHGLNKIESLRPGNRFFWHYAGTSDDDELIQLLWKGIDQLKLDPINLVFYYEYKDLGKKSQQYDLACTYKSEILLNEKAHRTKIYELPSKIRNKINKDREVFYIRSLDKELKLIQSLYTLETGKKLKSIKRNSAKKIEYSYGAFINYL